MQKKLIALAIASMATSAAFAQSADTVTLYGRADVGFVSRSGQKDGIGHSNRTTEMASGIAAGSRVGFRGVENLGGGVKAIFLAEFGVDTDNGTNSGATTWWNRQSYVGVSSANYGTLLLGRQYSFRYINMQNTYDPFKLGTVGNMAQVSSILANRANNTAAYVSPKIADLLTLSLGYSLAATAQENDVNINDLRWTGVNASIDKGPLNVALNYEQAKAKGSSDKLRAITFGGAYDLGVVRLSAMVDQLKATSAGVDTGKELSWFVGARAPMGAVTLKAGVGQNRNKIANATTGKKGTSTKFGLGLDYSVSKRTNFYVDVAKVTFKDGGSGGLYGVNTSNGALTAVTTRGVNGVDFGIAHNF